MVLKQTKAWHMISEYVRRKARGVCYTCDRRHDWQETDCGHFIHKISATFFDIRQLRCQCVQCNRWLHGNLGIFALRLEDEIGREAINEIRKISLDRKIWKEYELKLIEMKYKGLIADLKKHGL